MQPATLDAVHRWKAAHDNAQAAAVDALAAAFPPLQSPATKPTGCCDIRMLVEEPGAATGSVCIDTDGRVTIDLAGVPTTVAGEAVDEVWGVGWLDFTDGPLAEAELGSYSYDDESTNAEYQVEIKGDGTAVVYAAYALVPDAAELLDALTEQLGGHGQEQQPVGD
jgi:hypothetical protein